MTVIDISRTPDEIHDAMVRELRASGGFGVSGASGGYREPGPDTINRESILRMAYLLANGVRVSSIGGPFRVLGDAPKAIDGPWSTHPLPIYARLSEDLSGHVEVLRTGRKLAYRRCIQCGDNFTTERPASVIARWPSYCGAACRKARDAARKRKAKRA